MRRCVFCSKPLTTEKEKYLGFCEDCMTEEDEEDYENMKARKMMEGWLDDY